MGIYPSSLKSFSCEVYLLSFWIHIRCHQQHKSTYPLDLCVTDISRLLIVLHGFKIKPALLSHVACHIEKTIQFQSSSTIIQGIVSLNMGSLGLENFFFYLCDLIHTMMWSCFGMVGKIWIL